MINNNSIYIVNSSLPQRLEATFSNPVNLENKPSQATENKEVDTINISENLNIKKENYIKTLEKSQNSVSFSQNAIKNIEEFQQNILNYKNTDKKDDFLKNIEKNISEVQKFQPNDNTVESKAIGEFVSVLSQVKEKISSLEPKDKDEILKKAQDNVTSSKETIDNNVKQLSDSVQAVNENYDSKIKDKNDANQAVDEIKFLIKGKPENVKAIQEKAINGETILALLKAL